jgi:hypothetical protein
MDMTTDEPITAPVQPAKPLKKRQRDVETDGEYSPGSEASAKKLRHKKARKLTRLLA